MSGHHLILSRPTRSGPGAWARGQAPGSFDPQYAPRMIRRLGSNLGVLAGEVPAESAQLERDGYAVVRDVLAPSEIEALTAEILAVFASTPPDRQRNDRDEFRYAMLNRSALSQATAGHPRILAVIEPLLGDDCHVIANTA